MEDVYYNALLELNNYNPKLLTATDKMVKYFRVQQNDEALDLFISATDGFNWTLEVLSYTKHILEKQSFIVEVEKINEIFMEMTEALQNQDFVLLADLLEYEIYPLLEQVQTTLNRVIKS